MGERKGAPCGVGARVLTAKAPVEASIGARQRRWRARVGGSADSQSPQRCHEIMDKAECCATIDQEGDVCVPAVTTFSNGAVCAGWTSFLKGSEEARTVAACPPQQDLATKSARSRVRLADGVSCALLSDRIKCCSAVDGRLGDADTQDAPCVPAVTTFKSGAVCESATHVADEEVAGAFDSLGSAGQSAASCAELGGSAPFTTAFGEDASVAHDVQRLTITKEWNHEEADTGDLVHRRRLWCRGGLHWPCQRRCQPTSRAVVRAELLETMWKAVWRVPSFCGAGGACCRAGTQVLVQRYAAGGMRGISLLLGDGEPRICSVNAWGQEV